MPKKTQRSNFNFRETRSERSATQSYRNFGAVIRKHFTRLIRGKKYGTN